MRGVTVTPWEEIEEGRTTVPDDDQKQRAFQALKDSVLDGAGQRARAFANEGLAPPLDALIDKVAERPKQVTEDDLAAAKASGLTEDQIFELVVCAAVGKSARLYEAGLAALTEAALTDSEVRPDRAA
jgi:alkylhydroperoxidase family enzyme